MNEIDDFATRLENDQLVIIETEHGSPLKIAKSLLCRASKYFVEALEGGFKEATEQRLVLPGCDDDYTARILVYWICHDDLPDFAKETRALALEHLPDDLTTQYMHLTRLWMLADQVLMPKLQNAAMEQILKMSSEILTPASTIREVCLLAPKGSMLRKMFMVEAQYEYFAGNLSEEELEALDDIPGLLTELLSTAKEMLSSKHSFEAAWEYGINQYRVSEEDDGETD